MFWSAQGTGWVFYLSLLLLYNYSDGNLSWLSFFSALSICAIGFVVSSLLRLLFVKLNWHKRPLKSIIIKVTVSSFLFAFLFHALVSLVSHYILGNEHASLSDNYNMQLQVILNWALLLLFWSLMFFTANYFLNYRSEQIRTANLEAENKRFEVKQLKSQLNPHFLFNALNSIKALINENPDQARDAINKLSNLLRRTLNTSGEELISVEEEINLVESYLILEKIRYESRLDFKIDACDKCLKSKIPPLLLQTLVENAVKHGIDKSIHGGSILINMKAINNNTTIDINNPGSLNPSKNKGIGLQNSKRRLRLIYGDKAKVTLKQIENNVHCTITIPSI